MHLYPRRWNVAAHVAEELKMVTCATPPPMEERRGKKKVCIAKLKLRKPLLPRQPTPAASCSPLGREIVLFVSCGLVGAL